MDQDPNQEAFILECSSEDKKISVTPLMNDDDPHQSIDSPASWLVSTILIFSGISALWFWNSILNLSELINDQYFVDYKSNISNIMTFTFEVSAVLSFVVCYKMDGTSVNMQLITAISSFILAFLPPLILLISNPLTRVILWEIATALFGAWVGLEQICHFGLAANLPGGVKTVLVSSGQGFSGIISYALFWLIVKSEHLTAFGAISVQMTLLIIITAIGPLGMWYLRTRPSVSRYIEKQKVLMEEAMAESGEQTLAGLIKLGWFPLLNVAMTFVFSYIVFPNIGPFKWPMQDDDQVNRVMGGSQLGQVLGRSAPLLGALIFPIKTTFVINCLRIIFPIMFTIAAVKQSNEVFSSYAFQCIMLFAISASEGWMASLGLLHSALAGTNIYERAELSKFASGVLSVAISCGLGLTFALRAAAGISV